MAVGGLSAYRDLRARRAPPYPVEAARDNPDFSPATETVTDCHSLIDPEMTALVSTGAIRKLAYRPVSESALLPPKPSPPPVPPPQSSGSRRSPFPAPCP